MKKTTRIILAILMVCISVFVLCSCGSDKKSIIGTWVIKESYTTVKLIFADDNTGVIKGTNYINDDRNYTEDFTWEIYSKYTYTDEDGKKTTYKPTDRYEGVLIINDDTIDIGDITYYRFDEKKERLYIVSPGDNKFETSLSRE